MQSSGDGAADVVALARARRRLLARRLPAFAAVWLPAAVAWSVALHIERGLTPVAVLALPALHGAMAAGAYVTCRRRPESPRVVPVVVATCAAIGITTIGLMAAVGSSAGFALVVLLLLNVLTALLFAWGWRVQLVLLLLTVSVWVVATPALVFYAPRSELAAGILSGSIICFVVAEGAARGFAATWRHRTAEARSRRELEASRNAYRDLAEQAHEPIFTVDLAGRLTYVNAAMASAAGASPAAVTGRSIFDLLSDHPDNEALRRLLEDPRVLVHELTLQLRTVSGPRWVETTPSPVTDGGSRPIGFRAICRDVTEEKTLARERDAVMVAEQRARVEAERARGLAEAAARARDHFLAVIAHELGSPLQVVLTWVRMLRAGRVPPERVPTALAALEDAGRALSRLASDMLDLSRIDAGKLSLHPEEVDLTSLLAARVEAAKQAAMEKGVTFEVHLAPSGVVRGDPTRLEQVFANLLANAVKFTPTRGRVTLVLGLEEGQAVVTVSDTGIGIAPEALPHVFNEFQQAGAAITERFGGLGLGLAIARRLVERHGGRIEAESAGTDKGATFRVRLPLVDAPCTLEHLRVLVVDDERDAREVLAAVLTDAGADVHGAASVREALADVEARPPDVVVTDIAMPDEDGYQLLRELRARDHPVPTIAITAFQRPGDHERALAEGFVEQLNKPVDPSVLVAVVARSVRSTG
jgi:PAS domain S-box-containing protein